MWKIPAFTETRLSIFLLVETIASGSSTTVPQRGEADDDNSVRALYSAFIPAHLHGEDMQQVQHVHQMQHTEGAPGFVHYQAVRPQLHAFAGSAISTDPTINALLSLSAKDKTVIQGVPVTSVQGLTVATMPVSSGGVPIFTSPNIAVVMPGQPLPNNMQWSWGPGSFSFLLTLRDLTSKRLSVLMLCTIGSHFCIIPESLFDSPNLL